MNQSGVSLKSCIGLLVAMSIGVIGGWLLRPSLTNGGGTVAIATAIEPATLTRSKQTDVALQRASPITSTDDQSFAYTPGIASSFSLRAAFYQHVMSLELPAIERLLHASNDSLVGRDYSWATSMLFARYAELDPVKAIREVEARSYHLKNYWFHQVFATYGFMNTQAALQQASRLPKSRRRDAHVSILSGIQHLDHAERQKIADQTDVNLVINLSGRDPRLAWHEAAAIEDEELRSTSLRSLAQAIAQTNPLLALELVEETAIPSEQDGDSITDNIISKWAKTDASAALNWLQAQPKERADLQQQHSILRNLASQDIALAVSALEKFPIEEQGRAIGTVGRQWAKQDAESAARWLSSLDLKSESEAYDLSGIGRTLGKQGLSFVEAWKDELPEAVSTPALKTALRSEAEANPAKAMEYIDRQTQATARGRLAETVIYNLAQKDPVVAATWLSRLEIEPNDRAILTTSLVSSWARQDNDEAYAFALDIAPPLLRDTALAALSSSKESSTQRIEEIYERIEQPILKLQVASALHNRIAATDPSRAAELRGQGRLSPRGGIDGEILQGCLLEQLNAK